MRKNLAISNTFEVIAHRVTQSSYYSVILRPTGVKLHHMIAYPKVAEWHITNNWAISNTFEDISLLLI